MAPQTAASQPVVLEFVGLPGAGKSRLSQQLIVELTARGYRCSPRIAIGTDDRPLARWMGAGRVLATNIVLLARALQFAASLHPYYPGRLRHTLRIPAWRRRWELARAQELDFMVLEEGLIQNLWGVFLGGTPVSASEADNLLRLLLRESSPSLAFVYFDVGIGTSLSRIGRRRDPANRIDRAPVAEQNRLLLENGPQLWELTERVAHWTGAPVLRVNAERPTEASLADVLRFAETLSGLHPDTLNS